VCVCVCECVFLYLSHVCACVFLPSPCVCVCVCVRARSFMHFTFGVCFPFLTFLRVSSSGHFLFLTDRGLLDDASIEMSAGTPPPSPLPAYPAQPSSSTHFFPHSLPFFWAPRPPPSPSLKPLYLPLSPSLSTHTARSGSKLSRDFPYCSAGTHTQTDTHAHTFTYIYTYTHAHIPTRTHMHVCVCVCVCMHMHVCFCVCVCVCKYIQTYTRMWIN
jgi:hypothetical protein